MPYKSRWTVPVPRCSLPTFLFGPSANSEKPIDNPDKLAFADAANPEAYHMTRDEFKQWTLRFAKGLLDSGLFKKGDRLLVFSANNLFVPVVVMGTLCAGGIFTGANPTFTPRELAHQLRDSGASVLICADTSIETGIEAANQANLDQSRVFVFNSEIYNGKSTPLKGTRYWGDLLASPSDARSFKWDDLSKPGEENTTLALNYSSGTTGVPKGVEITHLNYISNTLQAAQIAENHPDWPRRKGLAVGLCFLPLYHAYGQTVYIAGMMNRQAPVYVMPKFDFLEVLGYIQKYRITDLTLVPPIAVALAKHPEVPKYDLTSVHTIGCGAAPLGRDVSEQVEKRMNAQRPNKADHVNMKQGWGMTECTCSLLGWDINKVSYDNSVGEPNANCEAMVVDENTEKEITARGPEHRGELWCRGLNVMRGYWKNPKATSETLHPDGWLKTGDITYVDETGHFFIVDRKKELIKVKGNQVAPAELEALLLEHPDIGDAAVIGVPTPDSDEMPLAFVVRQPTEQAKKLTKKEVEDFVKGKVVRYKWLKGGVQWVDVIPKNPSGKILRRQLRDEWKAKHSKEGARL